MASGLIDTDSEDELPAGWEERVTDNGKVFYVSHERQHTQWEHPRTGRTKTLARGIECGIMQHNFCPSADSHITQKTTSTDPRLAFAVDDDANIGEVRQRFDASSTALQVLRGRDLTGLHVIITGANSGVGFETARSLALHGAHVILACRNMRSANTAVNMIKTEHVSTDVEAMFVDLTSLKTVKNFAASYISRNIPLNVLILNAGVFGLPHSLTDDGFETTFQTNHLGHFYLVQLLSDLLVQSAPSRVISVSAESHRFTDLNEHTICESLLSPQLPSQYWPIFSYNASKACNILLIGELHRQMSKHGVCCFAVHPGNVVATGITRHWWVWQVIFTLVRPFAKSKICIASCTHLKRWSSEGSYTLSYTQNQFLVMSHHYHGKN